jgi:cupin fold WbuC family metalloprotein
MATQSPHRAAVSINLELIQRKASDARRSRRRREIHVFHAGDADPLQRMLNAIQPGSYIQPHRHLEPPKSEAVVVLQGMLGYMSFAAAGTPDEETFLLLDPERGAYGCDIRPGVWHTIFALAPDTVIFEVKPGPYHPASDKDFAPWAPAEHEEQAAAYLAEIEDAFRRLWGLPRP